MYNEKEYSRKWIKEATEILVQSAKYEDISVADIIEKAGVSRRTFYNNFSSKFDLIEEVLIEGFEREGMSILSVEDELEGALKKFIELLFINKDVVANLYSEKTARTVTKIFHKIMQLFVSEYGDEISMIELSENDVYIEYIINVSSAILDTLIKRDFQESEEEVYFLITTILNIHKK